MNSEEILFDKYKQFVLSKDKDYANQIEENLRSLSELFHTSTTLQKMAYSIIKEYNDVVIVELNKDGDIKLPRGVTLTNCKLRLAVMPDFSDTRYNRWRLFDVENSDEI